MKKFLLATVSMVVLTSVTRGADMSAKAPVLAPVPMTNWAGGYLGIQGGVLRRDASMKFSPTEEDTVFATSGNMGNRTGGAVGGQLGYNWQQGRFVYGLESDWNRIEAKTHSRSFFTTSSYEIDWLATVRGRAGLAIDSTLFYVTGGAAFGRVKNTFVFISAFSDNSILVSYAQDKTKVGWTLGAGVEHRFAPHWTARAEFRYVDLGKTSAACTSGTTSCNFFPERAEFRNSATMGLVGLNYTFADARSPGWAQAQAYAPPSSPVWAGTYLAIQGGVARRETSLVDPDAFLSGGSNFIERNGTGGTVGGLLGYNWQRGSFVYSVEGDWSWVGARTSRSIDQFNAPLVTSFDVNWLATLRGRAGLAFDAMLFYVTGGLAAGHIRNNAEHQFPGIESFSFTQSQTKLGWTAGVGAEYMFSSHWTARAEFRYVDLGTKQVSCTTSGSGNCTFFLDTPYRGDFSNKLILGLVGLAYKF